MDAGVPIKAPVAGCAMGLIKDVESGKVAILTDIQGLEDFLGDMDFKVAGTTKGITAIQMDIKIKGIDESILKTALSQAREGRLEIMEKMVATISESRDHLSVYAPKIISFKINPEKIGAVIGKGGETINKITSETGAEIDIKEDGLITVASADTASIEKALNWIKSLTEEPEVGKLYHGKVVSIKDFGAFVNIMPGIDGMLHISQIREGKRLKSVDEVLKVGDKVKVRLVAIDHGKLSLSMINVR
jgi:polyribonucleotide nucleotidyltransferase